MADRFPPITTHNGNLRYVIVPPSVWKFHSGVGKFLNVGLKAVLRLEVKQTFWPKTESS